MNINEQINSLVKKVEGIKVEGSILSYEEVMRWYFQGADTQGQPMGRITQSNQVNYLIRGQQAFDQMVAAIKTAQGAGHFIYLLGWILYDDFELSGQDTTTNNLFKEASNRGAQVRAMLWGPSWGTARVSDSAEEARNRNSLAVANINQLVNGAAIYDSRGLNYFSHHQKILIVNGSEGLIAFCGGVDINPDRIKPDGHPGRPMHDVHCRIKGPAAFDLLTIFTQRWNDHPNHKDLDSQKGVLITTQEPSPVPGGREYVQVGRTFGNGWKHKGIESEICIEGGYSFLKNKAGEQTAKAMLLYAIRQAREFIYIEDQYLVNLEMRDALIEALPNISHITILVQANEINKDSRQDNYRRRLFIQPLKQKGGSKVRIFNPIPAKDQFGYIHSKATIIDDKFALIGSANCNRRSYTHDSEVIAGICDPGDGIHLRFAHRLRIALWATHLRLKPESLVDGVESAKYWFDDIPSNYIQPHDENACIETIHTDMMWDDIKDPDGG